MSPHCDLDLEDSKRILSHDTLAHDDASPYQVWLQKVQPFRRHGPDENSLIFILFDFILCCDLDLAHNKAIKSVHNTAQLMTMRHQTKVWLQRISSSDDTVERHIQIISAFIVTLTLTTAKQPFRLTLRLMMMQIIPCLITKCLVVQKISSGQS